MESKIFDTLLEPIFLLSADKKIIYCNEPAALICDQTVRRLLRSPLTFDQIFLFQEPVSALTNLNEISDATPYQEVAFTTESGKAGKVQVTFQPFDSDGQKAWIVFFRDVTLEETLQKKYRAELEQKEGVIEDLKKAQAQLEKYSKGLEIMVGERTAALKKVNQMMSALLDSLGQGFFVFNKEGACLEVFSKACEQTVQIAPPGHKIWDVLKLSSQQVPGFQKWMTTLFAEMLPFEDLAPLGPAKFPHSENREIKLDYYPLKSNSGKMDGIVVVATDITDLILAQKEAETERAHAKMIVQMVQNKRQIQSFLSEAQSILGELNSEFAKPEGFSSETAFRCLHTMKGGAATFSIQPVAEQCHESETLLTQWKTDPSPESWSMLKQSSDLVTEKFQAFLKENEEILGSAEHRQKHFMEIEAETLKEFQKKLPQNLKNEFSEAFLMEEIISYFTQYQDVTKAVAEQEMKQVHPLRFVNPSLKILTEVYDSLFNTFTHAFRNAVDHGIETPSARAEKGKPEAGSIEVRFSVKEKHNRQWLTIQIQDDGGGIDPIKIRERLMKKGISTSHETNEEVIQHVFDSQFSTKEVVTTTSGRGVGMDAILHSAMALGGRAWVESRINEGTTLTVEVPYLLEPSQTLKKAA